MYCKRCGKQIEDGSTFCPFCGSPLNGDSVQAADVQQVNPNDSGSMGWAVLGFFCTLAGFILWLVWMNDKPKSGKMAGLGALFSVIIWIVLPIVFVVIFAMIGGMSTTTSLLFI